MWESRAKLPFVRRRRSPPLFNNELPRERAQLAIVLAILDSKLDEKPLQFRITVAYVCHETSDDSGHL